MSKHKHCNHCKHLRLKYCDCCRVVFCEDCGEEWKKDTYWYYKPYYATNNWTSETSYATTVTCSHK